MYYNKTPSGVVYASSSCFTTQYTSGTIMSSHIAVGSTFYVGAAAS